MVCITALWEQLPKTDCKSPRPIPGHPFTLKPCIAYVFRGSSDLARHPVRRRVPRELGEPRHGK